MSSSSATPAKSTRRMPTTGAATAVVETCPTCQADNPEGNIVCDSCGAEMHPAAKTVNKGLRRAFLIVGLLVILLGVAAIVFSALRSGDTAIKEVSTPVTLSQAVEPGTVLSITLDCGEVEVIVPRIPDGATSYTKVFGTDDCSGKVQFDLAK